MIKTGKDSKMKKVLLTDIVEKTGCSPAQISRALNGKPNVAPEVRATVLRVARELNYRNRANRHKPHIALLKKGAMSYYTGNLIYSIENVLNELDWSCQVVDQLHIGSINEYFFDGVIAYPWGDYLAKQWPNLRNIPLVIVNDYGSVMDNICSIDPDFTDEANRVLSHLYELGHRKIARIRVIGEDEFTRRYRLRGENEYNTAARAWKGLTVECLHWDWKKAEHWPENLKELFRRGITAIIMVHPYYAAKITSDIQMAGYRIPEDVSLITEEVPCFSPYALPAQTTLQPDIEKTARTSIEYLRRLMHGEPVPTSVKVPNVFTIRDSTGPAPGSVAGQ